MSSRRSGKTGRALFGNGDELTMRDAADLIYGDTEMLDQIEGERVILRAFDPQELTIDSAIQVRVKPNPQRVEELKQVLLNGSSFKDPIRVYRDHAGVLWLAAGFRRTEATAAALAAAPDPTTIAPLMGYEIPGEREDALEDAENDNLKHGEPLSTEDKRAMFERRYMRGHVWFSKNQSNRLIAAELAVSEGTIRNWFKALSSLTAQNYAVRENTGKNQPRIGADGRTYKTGKIQRAAKKRAARKSPAESEPVGTFQDQDEPSVTDRIMAALHEHGDLGPAHLSQVSGLTYADFNLVIDDLVEDGWIEKRRDHATGRVTFHALVEPEPGDNPNAVGNLVDTQAVRRRVINLLSAAVESFEQLGETDEARDLRAWTNDFKKEWGI